MGIFETLLDVDDELVDWVLHASPTNAAESAQMKQVLSLRGDVEDALNALVAYRMKLAASGLSPEATRLTALSGAMRQLAKRIDTVQQVLTIAGEVVQIASKAVVFVEP